MALKLSAGARLILATLAAAGYKAYVVGGAVRNLLLALPVEDWDFVTTAPAEEILRLFERAQPIGGEYGTVSVYVGDATYEITPCRTEDTYLDGRHPALVRFGASLEQDLSRRDFTMNAIAYSGKALIDPFGGVGDIQKKYIRAVGVPEKRFAEDRLRILRAFRFAATLGFTIEPNTREAALANADKLGAVSSERVRAELQKALLGINPAALAPLAEAGGFAAFGIAKKTADLAALAKVPQSMLLRWWAFLYLCNASADEVCARLHFSHGFLRDIKRISQLFRAPQPATMPALKMLLRGGVPADYLQIARTFAALGKEEGLQQQQQLYGLLLQSKEPYAVSMLALGGDALLANGFRGKQIGQTLNLLLDAVIQEPSLNRYKTLLALANSTKPLFIK